MMALQNPSDGKKLLASFSSKEQRCLVLMLHKRHEDSVWLAKNHDDIKRKYADKFIAIRGQEIVGTDNDEQRLRASLESKYEDVRDITISFIGSKEVKLFL